MDDGLAFIQRRHDVALVGAFKMGEVAEHGGDPFVGVARIVWRGVQEARNAT